MTSTNEKIRVLICDDHPMMVIGVKDILSLHPSIEVIGTASTSEEALSKARKLQPDVILMDIGMPDVSGLVAARMMRKEFPEIKVIILTMYDDEEYVRQFIESGASGYVLKKNPPDELVAAIKSVYQGHAFMSPAVSEALLKEHRKVRHEREEELTDREREVLIYMAKGLTSKEIASKLFISPRTVGKYRELIMQKLNIHSVADVTKYAITKKLIRV